MPTHRPRCSGVHFLSAEEAGELVRSSDVGAGDLVIDVGAGPGAITALLAATGARVLAVERDDQFVRRLERRFQGQPNVRIVHGDLREVPLPRRRYTVVASVPFAASTHLARRLLHPAHTALTGADLVVEWGFAKRLTEPYPRSLETAWWAGRFELHLTRRIPPAAFAPPPAVAAAHLVIRRRGQTGHRRQAALWALLHRAYSAPNAPARAVVGFVPRRRAHRLLTSSGIDPPAAARTVPVPQWVRLAAALAADPDLVLPPLPRRLSRG